MVQLCVAHSVCFSLAADVCIPYTSSGISMISEAYFSFIRTTYSLQVFTTTHGLNTAVLNNYPLWSND